MTKEEQQKHDEEFLRMLAEEKRIENKYPNTDWGKVRIDVATQVYSALIYRLQNNTAENMEYQMECLAKHAVTATDILIERLQKK